MSYCDRGELDAPIDGAGSEGEDLSFAAFSFTHADCGEAVVELRLGKRLLLGWCSSCAALEIFGVLGE